MNKGASLIHAVVTFGYLNMSAKSATINKPRLIRRFTMSVQLGFSFLSAILLPP